MPLRGGLKPALKGGASAGGLDTSPSRRDRPRKRVVLLAEPVAVARLSPCAGGQQWYNEHDYQKFEAEADALPPPVIKGIGVTAMLASRPARDTEWAVDRVHRVAAVPGGHKGWRDASPAVGVERGVLLRPSHKEQLSSSPEPGGEADLRRECRRAGRLIPFELGSSPPRRSPLPSPLGGQSSPRRSPRRVSPRFNGARGCGGDSQLRDLDRLTMDELKAKIREVARRRRERQGRYRSAVIPCATGDL